MTACFLQTAIRAIAVGSQLPDDSYLFAQKFHTPIAIPRKTAATPMMIKERMYGEAERKMAISTGIDTISAKGKRKVRIH